MAEYYLGIDQGTTGTMALLLDKSWKVVAKGYRRHRQYYPKPGWVEQDAVELWKDAKQSVQEAVRKAGIRPGEIRGIGLDHQGESVVVWDRITGIYRSRLFFGRTNSSRSNFGRPAGSFVWSMLFSTRRCESHLWNGMLFVDEYGRQESIFERRFIAYRCVETSGL